MINRIQLFQFLSTPSARRATFSPINSFQCSHNFYPRPPRGGRPASAFSVFSASCYFYPRPPRGGRHLLSFQICINRFISIHALREEGDKQNEHFAKNKRYFYPRPPRGGRRGISFLLLHLFRISIHALREEGDYRTKQHKRAERRFLSTPSARRATPAGRGNVLQLSNFYPHPPRGGRLSIPKFWYKLTQFLSPPSARRATAKDSRWKTPRCLFLSPPSARRATIALVLGIEWASLFLSPPSARRATWTLPRSLVLRLYFYPHPPRGGRPNQRMGRAGAQNISIPTLREEGDRSPATRARPSHEFLSPPSARRATQFCGIISTTKPNFYPHPPRGGRQKAQMRRYCRKLFLSPPSARRATSFWKMLVQSILRISIPTLREEGDRPAGPDRRPQAHFYPHPPRGGRQRNAQHAHRWRVQFLSPPSARRATMVTGCWRFSSLFLSPPSARRATRIL